MMTDFARLESLFFGALSKPQPEQRRRFLDAECGQDASLRDHLERLLAGHAAAGSFLENPVTPPELTQAYAQDNGGCTIHGGELLGTVIAGKYKLLEEIGEGGMGTVFVAEQTEPVKRKVAVKLIKAGMDSKSVLARFEAERQALAMMDHPNIARVLDAGLTEERRPYFVMEYIKGLPLTKYCDDVKLSIDARLQLFIQICQAVQHAHQKGIIHRDLKPGNILIALYDGKPVPKVIDFGLAKALHQSLTDRTLHTGHAMVLGTPLYMSPEQAELNNFDIDTRSDIYSLGVILYELLTGVTPLEKARFKEAAWAEVLRIIKEEEPSKPSTKLSQSNSPASVAAQRQMEPKKLSALMKGDLDWIVMKALEKDRNRRYETANGFAADVLRYLSGEAVTAAPPSAGYRLRKFVKRNKGKVIAIGTIIGLLIAGITGTTFGLFQATQSANTERLAKLDAEAATELTAQRLKQIETINNTVFDIFTEFDIRKVKKGKDPVEYVLAQKLIAAGKKLDAKAIHDPLVLANLQRRLGVTLLSLGQAPAAIELLTSARNTYAAKRGPDHLDTLYSMSDLAAGYQAAGKLDLALPLYEETFKLTKATLGPDHSSTLASMSDLAAVYRVSGKLDLALPLYEETLKLMKAKLGPVHRSTLTSMGGLALCYRDVGKLDLALPLFEETLRLTKDELGPDHHDTLDWMATLAVGYRDAGKLDLALPLFEENLKRMKVTLGAYHPETLISMNNLAAGYRDVGKLNLALPLYEETSKLRGAKLGPDHPDTLLSMNNLAEAYRDANQLDRALPLYEETLTQTKAKLGLDHPQTLVGMNNLAEAYRDANQFDRALPLHMETFKLMKAKLGPDHPLTLVSMCNLGETYRDTGKLDQAQPLFEETFKLRKAKLGPDHPQTFISMSNLASGYREAGKLDRALPLSEEVFKLSKAKLGPDHPDTLFYMNHLALSYQAVGKLDLAISLFEETMKRRKAALGPNHPATLGSMKYLGTAYCVAKQGEKAATLLKEFITVRRKLAAKDGARFASVLAQVAHDLLKCDQFPAAEEMLRECLTLREKTEPDVWSTFNTKSLLGGALLGQKKYADAEPQLLKGYEGMKQREKAIPLKSKLRLSEALDRIIQFYTETNKPDEVKKWQGKKVTPG